MHDRDKGLCVVDGNHRVVSANAALVDMLGGADTATLLGMDSLCFLPQIARLRLERASRCDLPFRAVEAYLQRLDGTLFPALIAFEPLNGSTSTAAVGRLIVTPRRPAPTEPVTWDASQRLDIALRAGALGAWSLDLRSGQSWRTRLHDEIFGYADSVAQWTFEIFLEHVIPDDRDLVQRALTATIANDELWDLECRICRADGIERWIWLQGEAEYDRHGDAIAVFGVVKDITDRKEAEARISFLAYYDALTRLPNRGLLIDRIAHAALVSSRNDQYAALFFLDLDDFKSINDTLGHKRGDETLVLVANRLRDCLREQDTIARFGGDEFVILIEELGANETQAVATAHAVGQKILQAIGAPPETGLLQHRRGTASIGAVLFCGDGLPADVLLQHADMAMYRAKAEGGDMLAFFDPQMQIAVQTRIQIESDLHRALASRELALRYQPQIESDQRIVGLEALVRWMHPERGELGPADFIYIAEASGQIRAVGCRILEAACEQLQAWGASPQMAHLRVSVNVSAAQFRDPDFVVDVCRIMRRYDVQPGRLTLELTEGTLLHCVGSTRDKIVALKAHGVRFSLDDFGSGYSSLYYLKNLPLDQLKIDQRFVAGMCTEPDALAIVRTIIALSSCLGLEVIAEGVEDCATRDLLVAEHCHLQQGFLFSQPLSPVELESFAYRSSGDRRTGPGYVASARRDEPALR